MNHLNSDNKFDSEIKWIEGIVDEYSIMNEGSQSVLKGNNMGWIAKFCSKNSCFKFFLFRAALDRCPACILLSERKAGEAVKNAFILKQNESQIKTCFWRRSFLLIVPDQKTFLWYFSFRNLFLKIAIFK